MKKRAIFIIPYFGKFPNYFQLFLNSCKFNRNYDWVFLTDIDMEPYKLPENVRKVYMTFERFKEKISEKLGFAVCITNYHKICDYKPTYGYVFENLIENYEFWGYMDIDMLLGKIDDFISDDIWQKYDKLFSLGHFTLYKNTKENNRLFMSKIDGKYWYKESFTTNETTVFDETYGNSKNINTIFLKKNKKIFNKDFWFDVKYGSFLFFNDIYDSKRNAFYIDSSHTPMLVWDNGYLTGLKRKNEKIESQEYMYIHMQDRRMKLVSFNLPSTNYIKIIPDALVNLNHKVSDINIFNQERKFILSFSLFKHVLKGWRYGLTGKIRCLLNH